MPRMRIVTIWQPWAYCVGAGLKPVENRSQHAYHRGPVAIHAGLKADTMARIPVPAAAAALEAAGGLDRLWRAGVDEPGPPLLARGAIIAVADLVDSHHSDPGQDGLLSMPRCLDRERGLCSPWAIAGKVHWQLANVRPLAEPMPYRGTLGLHPLLPQVEAEVLARITVSPLPAPPVSVGSTAGPGHG
ncbi:hypothetical protein [Nonomuraea sp. NPDC049646]|uniref:hypothetical protein n=1 Tax=unclassified Nonomuraea TaxID=2593643 RepID=UPI0037A9C7CD